MFTPPARAYRVVGWPIAASRCRCSSATILPLLHPTPASPVRRSIPPRDATRNLAPSTTEGPPPGDHRDGGTVMEHAHVNGVELDYKVVGSGEPMLFIHGAHIADALRPLVDEPTLERFQRIRYHRRGLGRTGPAPPAVQTPRRAPRPPRRNGFFPTPAWSITTSRPLPVAAASMAQSSWNSSSARPTNGSTTPPECGLRDAGWHGLMGRWHASLIRGAARAATGGQRGDGRDHRGDPGP
jgi:hypothetical protein